MEFVGSLIFGHHVQDETCLIEHERTDIKAEHVLFSQRLVDVLNRDWTKLATWDAKFPTPAIDRCSIYTHAPAGLFETVLAIELHRARLDELWCPLESFDVTLSDNTIGSAHATHATQVASGLTRCESQPRWRRLVVAPAQGQEWLMGDWLFWMADNLTLIRPFVLAALILLVIACVLWWFEMTIDDD